MRLIDADALKKCFPNPADQMYAFAFIDAIDEAPTVGEDMNVPGKWFRVRDRLPDIGEGGETEVLAIVSGQIGKVVYDHAYRIMFCYSDGSWSDEDYNELEVHCWTPLPETSEEDER